MSARTKRKRKSLYKRKKKGAWFVMGRVGAFGFFLLVLIGLFVLSPAYWSGDERLVMVIDDSEVEVGVLVVDPVRETTTYLAIPSETEVEVSRSLGVWKVGKVWELGQDEGVGGRLLAESITGSFKYPVEVWVGKGGVGLVEGGVVDTVRAVFGSYETNLNVADKLRLVYFRWQVKNWARSRIELADTTTLRREATMDGELVYRLTGTSPASVLALFALEDVLSGDARVFIKDGTDAGIGRDFGKVVELMGAKVVAIDSDEGPDIDCRIDASSENMVLVDKLNKVFGCDYVLDPKMGGEVVVVLGKKFGFFN